MKKNKDRSTNFWQMQDAKAKFSQLVKEACTDGYQVVTKNGEPVAVIISQKEFYRLKKPKSSLLDFFKKAPFPDLELDIRTCSGG